MRLRALSRFEVRSIDERARDEFGLSTLVLMENAGRGAAETIRSRVKSTSRVLIICGPGNNGGDGGVVARFLDCWGYQVEVVWLAEFDRLSADAKVQYHILEQSKIIQSCQTSIKSSLNRPNCLDGADWIIDAIFGTGLSRPVEGMFQTWIDWINSANKPVLSLDIPSGLDCDLGVPLGVSIHAKSTATFVSEKLGFLNPQAKDYTGEIQVIEIGAPRRLLNEYRVEDAGTQTNESKEYMP
jgi:NAD(P)H-hydrate epimerase